MIKKRQKKKTCAGVLGEMRFVSRVAPRIAGFRVELYNTETMHPTKTQPAFERGSMPVLTATGLWLF